MKLIEAHDKQLEIIEDYFKKPKKEKDDGRDFSAIIAKVIASEKNAKAGIENVSKIIKKIDKLINKVEKGKGSESLAGLKKRNEKDNKLQKKFEKENLSYLNHKL